MNRRMLLALVSAALADPPTLFAQSAKRVFRIALLDDSVESARDVTWRNFRNRLRELILADGNDVAYEARYARGNTERLPVLAAELVALKPDIIVCPGSPPTIAAMKATSSIPIVFVGAADPVGTGLVTSLARPEGNVTGTSILSAELTGKLLELMHDLFPGATRLAYLIDPSNKASASVFHRLEQRARAMNVTVRMLDGRRWADLEHATLKRERVQGLIVSASGVVLEYRDQIVRYAAQHKLPAVYQRREYVDAGGLLSYSGDIGLLYARAAEYAHRILRGAKPAELPVEQVSVIRMVLNMKTARAFGIKIPESVRLRVDEVIE